MSIAAYGQVSLTTVAGGGPPDGAAATSISISRSSGIAVDAAGNLYIAAPPQNRVYRVAANGTVTVLAGTGVPGYSGDGITAATAQLNAPSALAVDSTGTNVYIADTNNHRIRKVTGGVITTVAGNGISGYAGDSGPAASAQITYPSGVAVDGVGNIYIADSGNSRVRKIASGTITTVAGNGVQGYAGDGGVATGTSLGPLSGIAVDNAGSNIYITDGLNNRIRKIAGGIITTVAGTGAFGSAGDGGLATNAQLGYPDGVAIDGAGNLYIADFYNYRIRKVSGGIITSVAGTGYWGYSSDGGNAATTPIGYPYGVAVNSAGTSFYIVDDSRIRKVTGGIITTAAGNGTLGYSGDGGQATSAQLMPSGIVTDSAGNLYIADAFNNRVRKVSGGGITTVAGTGEWGFSGDGGSATSAQFERPGGVAIDPSGNLYVADAYNNRIRKVTGGVVTTVAGTGAQGNTGDGGPATGAQLNGPNSVVADNAGNLYIADTKNNRIRKVSGGVITLVAGGGSPDGAAATTIAIYPAGVAVDASGNTYVTSTADHKVYRISANGTLTTVAGNGSPGYSGDGGAGASAQLNNPNGVAVDSAGNVYIADTNNSRIRKVSGGLITTVAGGGFLVNPADGTPATAASLNWPKGVAVDNAGNLFIAETSSYSIRKVTGGILTTVAGTGTRGYSGDGGQAVSAQFFDPSGVAVDNAGNLYIADTGNNRVRKVAGGIITTVAGTGIPGSLGDGLVATSAQLSFPAGVAVDSAGSVYIADLFNSRIRKVSGGIITTVAGNGAYGYSGDGGLATSASLGPSGVAVDGTGNLYISDANNYRVRKVTGGVISTIAGNGSSSSGDGGAAVNAQLSSPTGLALDGTGNLYFSDSGNNLVRMVSAAGTITTIAGNGTQGYWGDGGPATSAALFSPRGLAVSGGKVYILDQGNGRLRVVSGGVIKPVAAIPGLSFLGEPVDGGIAIDSAENLYVSNPITGVVSLVNGRNPAALRIFSAPYRSLVLGQTNVTYSIAVANVDLVTPTAGTVTVVDSLSAGLTLVSMVGTGWNCTGNTCTRSDSLSAGSSYPAITLTVNVAADAPSQVTNDLTVSGGGSASDRMISNIPVYAGGPPQARSVTPASGSGASQTFNVAFWSPYGQSDFSSAYVSINNGVTACMVRADLVRNQLYLFNDTQTAWLGPMTAGTVATLQNSQCLLNGATSLILVPGNDAVLNLALTFKPAFAGPKNVFGYVQSVGGLNSGWTSLGTWTVPSAPQSPQAVSVTPASGSGLSQTFDFVYSDPYGFQDVRSMYASINNGTSSCQVRFDLMGGKIYVLNDAQTAWLGPMSVNDPFVKLQNSQCTLYGGDSMIIPTDVQLTLRLALTFKSSFSGPKNVFGYVQNAGGLNSGWTQLGTWTVPVAPPPQAASVTPASGSGSSQRFSFVYSDAAGGTDLSWAYVSINNGVSSCMVQADLSQGLLYLMNDAQTAWLGPLPVMSGSTTVQNSQCTLKGQNSWVSASSTQATLSLDLTFKAAFAGPKNVYGYAQSASGSLLESRQGHGQVA